MIIDIMAEGCSSAEPCISKVFVERKNVMEWLKEKYDAKLHSRGSQYHKYRIYGIHGKKKVGKSHLVRTFLQQIKQDVSRNQKVHVGTFDFDKIKTFKSFLNSLCKFFDVEMHKWRKSPHYSDDDEEEDEDFTECMSRIENKIKAKPNNKFIVFLDNMENACGKAKKDGRAPDKLKEFLWDKIYKEVIHNLLPMSNNLLVFITSTQMAKFVQFGKVSCNIDLNEMDEDEAKCLLQSEVSGMEIDDNRLAAIVSLCDGLPPTIIKAGVTLRDGNYTHEEVTDLLRDFVNKAAMHSDDLCPIEDRYDAQLMKHINHLSTDNKKNLRSLAEMIKQMGKVSIADAAKRLEFENTAVFKLKLLIPLLCRGMVEVDRNTGLISMNSFFHPFVLEHIKGEDNVEETHPAQSSKNGQEVSPPLTNHSDDDNDDDGFDAESQSANHLMVPSQSSRDKASRLLEDTDIHAEADTQMPAVRHVTVLSHHTQDSSSRLLSEEKPEAHSFGEEKPEPNTAKMEGQYIGNREEKPTYDITLTNQSMETGNSSLGNNDLSPGETRNNTSLWNIGCPTENNGSVKNKSILADVKGDSNDNVKMLESNSSYKEDVVVGKACQRKRSDTFEENTRETYKDQSSKAMHSLMSVEDNNLQPYRVPLSSHGSISEKKINRDASFDDNKLEDHDPELGAVFSVDTDNNNTSDHIRFRSIGYSDGVILQSQRSVSTTTDMTEDDNCSETYEKPVYSNNSRTDFLLPDFHSPVTSVSGDGPSQFYAMSYLGSRDSHSQGPPEEDLDDPLGSSIASDKLFASGKFRSSAFHDAGQDQSESLDQCPPQAERPRHQGPDGKMENRSAERDCKQSTIGRGITQSDPTTATSNTRPTVTSGQKGGTSHNTSQIHLYQTQSGGELDTATLKDTQPDPTTTTPNTRPTVTSGQGGGTSHNTSQIHLYQTPSGGELDTATLKYTQPDPTTTTPNTRPTVTSGQEGRISINTSQTPSGGELDTATLKNTLIGSSVESGTRSAPDSSVGSQSSPHTSGHGEPAEIQERTGIFTPLAQFLSNTLQLWKEMES